MFLKSRCSNGDARRFWPKDIAHEAVQSFREAESIPTLWALVAALPEPGQATSYWLFHAYQDLCAEFCYKASKLFACQWDINES